MKVNVRKKRENVLLSRTEYELALDFDGATPSRKDMRDAIVQGLGCNPDLTVLRRTKSTFGKRQVVARVNVYRDEDNMRTTEPEYVIKRNGLAKEEPKEAPKEEAAEKPAEKPKEEKPAEKPKEERQESGALEPKATEKKEAPKEEKKEEPKKEEVKEEKKEEPKEEKKGE